jgi:hypothetical protein
MKIEPRRPNYTAGICCPSCEREMKDCDCELIYPDYSYGLDDEALDDPRHNQAKEINRVNREWKR